MSSVHKEDSASVSRRLLGRPGRFSEGSADQMPKKNKSVKRAAGGDDGAAGSPGEGGFSDGDKQHKQDSGVPSSSEDDAGSGSPFISLRPGGKQMIEPLGSIFGLAAGGASGSGVAARGSWAVALDPEAQEAGGADAAEGEDSGRSGAGGEGGGEVASSSNRAGGRKEVRVPSIR